MERKLATIEKVGKIYPIDGADAIERAEIRGWNVVVKKGEFKEGDLCVYCEIDSLMPERPEFEFLRPRGFRIKTIKLRGQVSQGIIFPISIIPKEMQSLLVVQNYEENIGTDVTEILGVIKYEAPIPACLGGVASGHFPSHSIKTDEERIQNLTDNYEKYKKIIWTATEKLDGSSCTYSIYHNVFGVASRNLSLKEHPENEKNSFWKFARENNVEEKMRKFMENNNMKSLTMQGELIGEGIQKNKYRIKGQSVRFFRIFDPFKYSFFSIQSMIEAVNEMGLKTVPIIETDITLPDTVEELIKYADGRSALFNTAREGIVFVAQEKEDYKGGYSGPLDEINKENGRLSFKVISNKFILKHNE